MEPKPAWLRQTLPVGPAFEKTRTLLIACGLETVCQEARCPNQWECYSQKTATFLLLGAVCTRNCRFCSVRSGKPAPLDRDEPNRIAHAVDALGLQYVILTSVTRDDLPDGGAMAFANTIRAIRKRIANATIEVLIPDFGGNRAALQHVVGAQPDVIGHNMETVARLYPLVRPEANYERSLQVLTDIATMDSRMVRKTGVMLGLGETNEELERLLLDIVTAGGQFLTLGQYLQPDKEALPVADYIAPEKFDNWKVIAEKIGFAQVASGPFVRSSYKARYLYDAHR